MNQSHVHGWSGHVCDQYYYITEYWHSHQTHINCNHTNSSGNTCMLSCTQKDYSDSRRHVKASNIQPGDSVLVKRRQLNKMMSRFDPKPYEVTDVKGPMITAQSPGGRVITSNSSFMKAVPTPAEPSVLPVIERTWPSPERPGPASMARPPGAHSLSPMAHPPGEPPSPLARPPGAPPHSPLARPRWTPPGQSTHVPSPRFEQETPESSLDSGTRPPDSNQGYFLCCRASVKTLGYLKDYVPWWFNDQCIDSGQLDLLLFYFLWFHSDLWTHSEPLM